MGFYGSVYYQLINAFYKIIGYNTGKNNEEFMETEELLNNLQTEALGRKGIMHLDSGNKWIGLSKEEGSETPLKIWHNLPGGESADDFKSVIKLETEDLETPEGEEEIEVIELDNGDVIETISAKLDKAGHVFELKPSRFKMPKAEVNNLVDGLIEAVGVKTEGREDDDCSNLYEYAEHNYDNVKTLNSYVGDWTESLEEWGQYEDVSPTISEVIGHLSDLFIDSEDTSISPEGQYINKKKSLVEIIGNVFLLWKNINGGEYISISDVLIKLNNELTSVAANTDAQLSTLNKSVVELTGGLGASITAHEEKLKQVEQDIQEIDTVIGDSTGKKPIYEEIEFLKTLGGSGSGEIVNYDDTAIKAEFQGKYDEVTGRVNDLETWQEEVSGDIENILTNFSTGAVETLEEKMNTVEDKVQNLENNYNGAENDNSIIAQLDTIKENAINLGARVDALELLGGVDTETGEVDLTGVFERIASVEEKTTKIDTLEQQYQSLNQKIDEEYAPIISTLGSTYASLTDFNTTKDLVETHKSTIEGLDTTYVKKDANYETMIQDISTIKTMIGSNTIGDDNIMSVLNSLTTELENIKNTMKQLHPEGNLFQN